MTENKEKKRPKKQAGVTIIMVLLLGVILFSGYKLISIYWNYYQGEKSREKVMEIVYYEGAGPLERIERETSRAPQGNAANNAADLQAPLLDSKEIAVDFLRPLKEQNPDTIGWISIPDTEMEFPVMFSGSNDTYLYADFFRNYSVCGSIFLDETNVLGEPLQNYIIYGHYMKDGSMFHDLYLYQDQSWVKEHPSFTLILEDGVYDCEVYAVILCTVYDDFWRTFFDSEEEKAEYIEMGKAHSLYEIPVEVSPDDFIVTLSTCEYTKGDQIGRMLIQAKLSKRWQQAKNEN